MKDSGETEDMEVFGRAKPKIKHMCQDSNCWRLEIWGGSLGPAMPLAPSSREIQPIHGVCIRGMVREKPRPSPECPLCPDLTLPHKFPLPQRPPRLCFQLHDYSLIIFHAGNQENNFFEHGQTTQEMTFQSFCSKEGTKTHQSGSIHSLNINKKVNKVL